MAEWHSHTHTHTHTLSHAHSHSHTLTHALTQTHTGSQHKYRPTHTRTWLHTYGHAHACLSVSVCAKQIFLLFFFIPFISFLFFPFIFIFHWSCLRCSSWSELNCFVNHLNRYKRLVGFGFETCLGETIFYTLWSTAVIPVSNPTTSFSQVALTHTSGPQFITNKYLFRKRPRL